MKPSERMAVFQRNVEEIRKTAVPQLLDFMVSLAMEGERSAVVLGAERINVGLTLLLKRFLKPAEKTAEDEALFERDGALATFARKIELAYRLGLTDARFKRSLDLIRKLRNDFAHATRVETLTEQKHADRLNELLKMVKKGNQNHFNEFLPFFEKAKGHSQHARNYLTCVMVLLVKLELVTCQLKPPEILLPALLDYRRTDTEAF